MTERGARVVWSSGSERARGAGRWRDGGAKFHLGLAARHGDIFRDIPGATQTQAAAWKTKAESWTWTRRRTCSAVMPRNDGAVSLAEVRGGPGPHVSCPKPGKRAG